MDADKTRKDRLEQPDTKAIERFLEPEKPHDQVLPSSDEIGEMFPEWETIGLSSRTDRSVVQRLRRLDDGQLGRLVFAKKSRNEVKWTEAQLESPYIAEILDYGEMEGYHYHLFEDVAGSTLAEAIETGRVSRKDMLSTILPQIRVAIEDAKKGGLPLDTRTTAIGFDREGQPTLLVVSPVTPDLPNTPR